MAKITKTFVDKVAAPAEGYEMHWDDSVKGYGLRVSAQGKKVFMVMGRVLGKSIQFTLGPYGTLTEAKARERAQKVLQDMREGIDPRAVVKADAAAKVSLQDVLEAYVGRVGKMKDSTAREYRRHVEKTFAKWAPLPIASITRDMVKERHAALVKGGLEGKKAAPASANAAFVTLRILIRFAMDEYRQADGSPLIRDNPVDALKHHWAKLGTRTERYIDRRKIGEVWNKLQEMRGEVQGYEALASVDLTIFALLTGARRDEMAALTWDRVHIDDHNPSECWWHLDDRKRGDPIWLPLSSQAVALLKSRPRLKLADGTESPFVFPSWGKTGRIMDARAPMVAIGEIAGKHLSLHDLRRSFTNYAMRECLIEKFRTDLLTGHKPSSDDVTARAYLDLAHLDWLQPDVQKVGDWIEQQAAIAASKNVVPLHRTA
ncbi:tyrosine-type recombinase/integrase [Sphingobium chlorophenolicum]|uniref:Putative prophage CP4-6 integrase n=1 Tax=Sphingobium chlorophenolicum TaxID=46429 RepID=A0A081RJW1_SPHCR|nr:integrase family protein [Sphingobium chlorophenolicum]KEQ55484.1 putative prophage CP4-6 integrase [Sphingobium chlorophenolicum]